MVSSFWQRLRRILAAGMLVSVVQTTVIPAGTPIAYAAGEQLNKLVGNTATPSTSKGRKNSQKPAYVPGEVIVKFKNGVQMTKGTDAPARAFAASRKMKLRDSVPGQNIGVLSIDRSETVEDAIARLKQDPNVAYVEPNYVRDIALINTNDTYKDQLWALDNVGQNVNGTPGTNDADIDAPEAWNISEGGNGTVIVAVIDTGVYHTHSDLSGVMWDGTHCVDESGAPLGGCMHGYDFVDNDKDPTPVYQPGFAFWHGTAVAGVIGAAKNNGSGVIGVAPHVKIMALRFGLDTASAVKAIDFALQNGAKIINASYGGSSSSVAELEAITRFQNAGGLFVAAAGNWSNNNDLLPIYPGSYSLPSIIAVAATDQSDQLASFSDIGATTVDVGAPGENIFSTTVGHISTTSFSADFEGVTAPSVPNGWTVTGTFGTRSKTGLVGNALYGDAYHLPYGNNSNGTAFFGPIDLSGTPSAFISLKSRCDTQYEYDYTDFMALEASSNGVSYDMLKRWDEIDLDNNTSDAGSSPEKILNITIPPSYLTSQTHFRFRWVTNGDSNTGSTGDGCTIDDVSVVADVAGGESYSPVSGTSFSAPLTAGLAALLKGFQPSLTAAEIKDIILTTGDSLPSLAGTTLTGKRINAEKALTAAAGSSVQNGALYVSTSTIPVRSHQLLGGALEDTVQRLTFRAEGEDISVTKLVITASGINAESAPTDIYRLELFFPGMTQPFGIATTATCGTDIVPLNSFCTSFNAQGLNVSQNQEKDVLVRPLMRADTDGAISGHMFGFAIDPTPSASTGSVHAIGLTSSIPYGPNDGDASKENEVIIGRTTVGPNMWVNSLQHQTVLSEISSITNANPNQDGTSVPNAIASIGLFKFSASPAFNPKNDTNRFTLSRIIFNVQATNVQLGFGDNTTAATTSFFFFHHADPTTKVPCTAGPTAESPLGQRGSLLVTCILAGSDVQAEISPGGSSTFVLQANVVNSLVENDKPSVLQVSLTNFNSIDLTSFGPTESHIAWTDKDAGSSTDITWIESPDDVIRSTLYSFGMNPVDTVPPVITLLGSTPVSATIGTAYIDAGATALDETDGDITARIVVTNPVDINTLGTYTIRYNVSDAAGNAAPEVTRTVEVVGVVPVPDTIPPVITLLGSMTVNVNQGSSYTDAGATAIDERDGDITANIIVTNPVNTAVPGAYMVRYNVADAAGNHALEVARTVNVIASESGSGGNGGGDNSDAGNATGGNGDQQRTSRSAVSNGSHRGHQTNVLLGIATYVAQQRGLEGGIPPASFGGGDVPLSETEKGYICSVQRALPSSSLDGAVTVVASQMSGYIGRAPEFIFEKLKSPTLCDEINMSLRPQQETVKVAHVVSFPVDKDGVPVSTNPFWNMCIREVPMTFADLQKNPEIDSRGRHYACDHYHRSQYGWRHPDLDILFTWNPKTKQLRLPSGFEAEKSDMDIGYDSTTLVSALPKKEEELQE